MEFGNIIGTVRSDFAPSLVGDNPLTMLARTPTAAYKEDANNDTIWSQADYGLGRMPVCPVAVSGNYIWATSSHFKKIGKYVYGE